MQVMAIAMASDGPHWSSTPSRKAKPFRGGFIGTETSGATLIGYFGYPPLAGIKTYIRITKC